MKKVFNIISFASIILLIITTFFTLVITHGYMYIHLFADYTIFKIILTATLLLWSVNVYSYKEKFIKNKMSILFGFLCLISFIFMIIPI